MELTDQERLDRTMDALDRIASELLEAQGSITPLNIALNELENNPCMKLTNTISVIQEQIRQKRQSIKRFKREREALEKLAARFRTRIHEQQ